MRSVIAGPAPLPLIGWRGNNLKFIHNRIRYMQDLQSNYGNLSAFCSDNPERWYFAFGSRHNQHILSDPSTFAHLQPLPFRETSTTAQLLNGLLTINGSEHTLHRAALQPLFQQANVSTYFDTLQTTIDQQLQSWTYEQRIDLKYELKQLSLIIFCRTILGLEASESLLKLLTTWLSQISSARIALLPQINLPWTAYGQLEARSVHIERLIRQQLKYKRSHGGDDAITRLINLEESTMITEEEIIGEIMTLLLAGHETSATALLWILIILAQHESTLDLVRTEIDSHIKRETPTLEALETLPLLDRVISEVLRLLPPITYQHRKLTTDSILNSTIIERGSIITYSPFITQRLEEYYKQPTLFNPERWKK